MPKLFQSTDKNRYLYKCPGCGHFHVYYVNVPNHLGAKWRFSGDLNSPFFDSTMLIRGVDLDGKEFTCHSMLRYGRVSFFADTTHKYKNTTLPLEEIPYN
jgi:hypothetical protein